MLGWIIVNEKTPKQQNKENMIYRYNIEKGTFDENLTKSIYHYFCKKCQFWQIFKIILEL